MASSSLMLLFCCCDIVYFLCQVQLTECQVTLVTRNVTDSFRVGEEGCKRNESICTSVQASCQEDGLCVCKEEFPHFSNPTIIKKNTGGNSFELVYGDSYGCMKSDLFIASPAISLGE